jgi:hypothetical protein
MGVCQSMPDEDYCAVRELVSAAFVRLVDHIDWNRVLLEATGRHFALHHKDDDKKYLMSDDNVCGECICEALLATTFGGKFSDDWTKEPTSPRVREGSHELPSGYGTQPKPSDDARDAAVTLAKALGYDGRSLRYED